MRVILEKDVSDVTIEEAYAGRNFHALLRIGNNMNMNIYKHEFRANLKSVITWSASLASLLFVFTALFPSMARDAALLNETLAQMPPELLTAFGMNGMDLSTVLGFFSFEFVFCQICLAIQAANYGFSLVSVEERDLTADFLLAKPVAF